MGLDVRKPVLGGLQTTQAQTSLCILAVLSASLLFPLYEVSYEPVHEISNNMVCTTSKASDQPAHTRSLIRAFASRLSIL